MPVLLHSLVTVKLEITLPQKMYAMLHYRYRKCRSSEILDANWKSAMEPISVCNYQQKQENK